MSIRQIRRIAAAALVGALVLTGCQTTSNGGSSNENVGTLLGAVVGAVVGSQLGDGAGNAVGAMFGAVAGGLIGNTIGGHLDKVDQKKHAAMVEDALDASEVGKSSHWSNPNNKTSGRIELLSSYVDDDGNDCIDAEQEISISGVIQSDSNDYCMKNGNWVLSGS